MNSSDGMLIVNVSAIQAVAIAAVTYYFGAWLRKSPAFGKVLGAEPGGGRHACRTGALLLGVFPPHAG